MDTARLFLAVPLEEDVIAALVAAEDRLTGLLPRARWCGPRALHLTVRFFGTLPLNQVEDIDLAVQTATDGDTEFEFQVRGLGGFPCLAAPRVLWAGVADGAAALYGMTARLNLAFGEAGLGREERAFVPHVTLARLKRRMPLDEAALERALPGAHEYDFGTSACDTLVLYASELTPQGPLYTRVAHWTLGAAHGV